MGRKAKVTKTAIESGEAEPDSINPIHQFTEEELQAEIARRKVEKQRQAIADREAAHQVALANIDALILMVPQHSRSTCSDYNIRDSGCARCRLLTFKRDGWIDTDIEISVEIREVMLTDPDSLNSIWNRVTSLS